jgi:hypothetical protein
MCGPIIYLIYHIINNTVKTERSNGRTNDRRTERNEEIRPEDGERMSPETSDKFYTLKRPKKVLLNFVAAKPSRCVDSI